MTIALNGVQTAPAYPGDGQGGCQIAADTLGVQLDITVGNAPALITLFYYTDPKGGFATSLQATNEFVIVAGSGQISTASYKNVVGFKARDFVSGTHATVYATLWEKGDPAPLGGTSYGGTLTGSGSSPGVSALNFQHNDVLVGTEPAADFEDNLGTTWTLTDDGANSRMKIALNPPLALLASTILGSPSTQVTFNNISQAYEDLELRIAAQSNSGNNNDAMQMWFQNDTTVAHYAFETFYGNAAVTAVGYTAPGSGLGDIATIPGGTVAAGTLGACIVDIMGYSASGIYKSYISRFSGVNQNAGQGGMYTGVYTPATGGPLNRIDINLGGATSFIAGSRFFLYGRI